MYIQYRIAILLLFAAVCSISGTSGNSESKEDMAMYYPDKETYEASRELSKGNMELVDSFYKRNNTINLKLDVSKDILTMGQ